MQIQYDYKYTLETQWQDKQQQVQNKLFDKTFNHVNVISIFLATFYLLYTHTGALNKIYVD
jgi:hypothetical protein